MTHMAVGPVHADRYWSHSCFPLLVQVPAGRHEEWEGLAVFDVAYAAYYVAYATYLCMKFSATAI